MAGSRPPWLTSTASKPIGRRDNSLFPADPARAALPRPVACDSMADTLETPKPLDIEMDQATWLGIFVADDGFDRPVVFHPRQLRSPENTANGGGRNAGFHGDMLTGKALSAKMEIRSTMSRSVRRELRARRDERSVIAVRPDILNRSVQRETIFSETP